MVSIALVGCNGRMGKAVSEAVAARNDCKILFGADPFGTSAYEYPVYKSLMESETKADVIIDFSNPALLDDILEYAVKYNTPCVICTTGFSADEINKINKTSENVAVFRSGNMSLGALGVISVFANICPAEMHKICQLCLDNDFAEAQKLNFHYLELMNMLFCDVNPIPIKTAMNLYGFDCGECRLPLVPMNSADYHNLKDCLAKYDLLGKHAK